MEELVGEKGDHVSKLQEKSQLMKLLQPMLVKHPKKVQKRGNFSMKISSPRVRSKC